MAESRHIFFDRDIRHMCLQFMESRKEVDGIMSFRTGKAEQERDIRMKGWGVAVELEEGIAEITLRYLTSTIKLM